MGLEWKCYLWKALKQAGREFKKTFEKKKNDEVKPQVIIPEDETIEILSLKS